MKAIRSLLETLIRVYRLEPGLVALRLQAGWIEAVGPAIGTHSYPLEIHRDTLIVVVDSPVWSQELSLFKPELLRKVNSLSDRLSLRQIRFRVGDLPKAPPEAPARLQRDLPLSPAETSWARELSERLSDPELQHLIQRTLSRALSRSTPRE
jgi:predicted nucleic acid-binding Zn ribbon protein